MRERVLSIVAEKTGYPADMLELDLDLEADLGVDTVKQAETFASIREAYDIPRDASLKLRDYPTLAHAIQFVLERRPQGAGDAAASAAAAPGAAGEPAEPGSAPRTLPFLPLSIGAGGFEPPTPCSQSRCATRLRHAPLSQV